MYYQDPKSGWALVDHSGTDFSGNEHLPNRSTHHWSCVVQALRDVVGKCLDKNPEARPTAAELLKHKFFKVHSTLE